MIEVVIWGAAGNSKVINEALGNSKYRIVAFFDIREVPSPIEGVPCYCGKKAFDDWLGSYTNRESLYGVCSLGGGRGKERVEYLDFFESRGLKSLSVCHPTAYIASDAELGEGSLVCARAVVEADCRAGKGFIANTLTAIGHESFFGDGVHVAPGSVICGKCSIGDYSFIGAGAVVLPRISIGKNVVVGAGSIVTKDVPDNVTVLGAPARLYAKN